MKDPIFLGPPMSWYDPPAERHSDGSIVKLECHCEECHQSHIDEDLVEWNAKKYPKDYPCCVDGMEDK